MIKKSFAISIALHVLVAAIAIYWFENKEQPLKPKPIPITVVTLSSVKKADPKAPKPVEKVEPKLQKVEEKTPPKETKPKVVQPKKVVQPRVPEPALIQVPVAKPLEEESKPVQEPKSIPPVEPREPKPQAVQENPALIATIKNQYLSSIYQNIDKRKQYPRSAKRLGQTGVVKVTFTVLSDGTITNISINEASGFGLLDEAAKEILVSMIKVKPIPQELKEKSITITVPINYAMD